jgi:site-specific DNA recombinase
MKTVAYLRVSTKEQAKNSKFGIPNQRQLVENYAERSGMELTEEFVDDGYSGSSMDRPRLQDLLEYVRQNQEVRVIVPYYDRWARDVFLHLYLEKELIKFGSFLESATEENLNDNSPHTELMRNMTIAFAQFERQRITARLAGGRRQKAKAGELATGRIPYGFKKNESGEIERVPEEVDNIRYIGELREDMSLRDIASVLNEEGKTKRDKKWSASSISYILKNDVYKGQIKQTVGGEKIESYNEIFDVLS